MTSGMEGGFKRGQLEYNQGTLYMYMKTSKRNLLPCTINISLVKH